MNQHNYQEARLKLFEDKNINKVWVYPKSGGKPYPQPAARCTAEENFQSPDLESFQQQVESRASRAFRTTHAWSELDYEAITAWVALHIVRNKKSRKDIFASPEDYNRRFLEEFRKELEISHYYRYVFIHTCKQDRFLITSDHPVVELWAECPSQEKDLVRCFAKSPEILVLFSARDEPPKFPIAIEEYFNAMVYAMADEFIFSHRNDVSIERLMEIAKTFEMSPVIENITFKLC